MTDGEAIEQAIDKAKENLNAHGYEGAELKDVFLVGIGHLAAKLTENRANEITINLQGKRIAGVAAMIGAAITGVIMALIGKG